MSRLVIFLILFPFAVYSVVRALRKRREADGNGPEEQEKGKPVRLVGTADVQRRSYPVRTTIHVEGMCCENCALRLEQALHVLPETLVSVSFEEGRAVLYSRKPQDPEQIRAAVSQAGFAVAEEKS